MFYRLKLCPPFRPPLSPNSGFLTPENLKFAFLKFPFDPFFSTITLFRDQRGTDFRIYGAEFRRAEKIRTRKFRIRKSENRIFAFRNSLSPKFQPSIPPCSSSTSRVPDSLEGELDSLRGRFRG